MSFVCARRSPTRRTTRATSSTGPWSVSPSSTLRSRGLLGSPGSSSSSALSSTSRAYPSRASERRALSPGEARLQRYASNAQNALGAERSRRLARVTRTRSVRAARSAPLPAAPQTPERLRLGRQQALRLRLLARRLVRMDRPRSRRLVEQSDELAMVPGRAIAVAVPDGLLEMLEERLRARAVAQVLQALARRGLDAALLLFDVRHAASDASSEEASGLFLMLA